MSENHSQRKSLTGRNVQSTSVLSASPAGGPGEAELQAPVGEKKATEGEQAAEGELSDGSPREDASSGGRVGAGIDEARVMARVKGLYQELLDAPVPDDFLRLIRELEEKERKQ
jgi:hypothetical protein